MGNCSHGTGTSHRVKERTRAGINADDAGVQMDVSNQIGPPRQLADLLRNS